jgi:diacylglycerol kinase (ATP)
MSPTRRSVAIVVNANARKFVDRPALIADIARLAEGRAHVHVTRTREELRHAAEAIFDARADLVVLCGGDGTYSAGATAIHRAFGERPLPVFALGPGGTVGTVARSLGVAGSLPRGTLSGIAHVLHDACSDAPVLLAKPTLLVRADDGAPRVSFIFGTGLVASFFELYDPRAAAALRRGEESDGPSGGVGLLGAAAIVSRIFVGSFYGGAYARRVLDPLPCDVFVDGERLPWSASSLVVASVISDLGLGMRVTHRGAEDPGRPHVVVSGLPPRKLGPRMTRVLRGVPIGDPGEPCFDGLATTMRVRFPGGSGPFVLDGDLGRAAVIEVSAGPILRILAPGPIAS